MIRPAQVREIQAYSMVELTEKVSRDLGQAILRVSADLLLHAKNAEDYITKTFGTSGTAHETVKASMIASALGLLRTAADSGDEKKLRMMVDALANAQKIALTVGSKALKKSGHLTKETIHDIGAYIPLVQRGSDISQEYRDTIRAMQLAQYKERAGGYQSIIDVGGGRNIPLWQALDESLLGALTSADSRFYLLIPPQDTKIPLAASLRFDDRADGVHMASVMTALDGSGVGELHAQASFEKECDMLMKDRIYAECDRASGITQKYHEWGFVTTARKSTNERDRDDINALLTFDIEWRKERNDALTTTAEKMTQDEVVKNAQERDNAPQEGENVRYFMHVKPNEDGTNPVPGEKFALLDEGFVMTRYFTRGTTNYAVFEKDPLTKK
jgi:hypothetical protein